MVKKRNTDVMRQHMKERFGEAQNFMDNPPLPKSLNIELNSTCNHKCIFCPLHGPYAQVKVKPTIMDIEIVKQILNEANRLGIGKKEIGFYLAGEAFLYNGLADVISYAKKLGFKYTFLTSNGAIATEDKMKKVLDAGIDSLRFSINAANKEDYVAIHGQDDFEQVINNLSFMRKYIDDNELNVATSISCVITKKTQAIKEEMRRKFEQYVDDIVFIPVILDRLDYSNEFYEEYDLKADLGKVDPNYVCGLLFDTMYITSDMKVIPCCDAYERVVVYDLMENMDLEKAWNSEGYKRYRNIFLNKESDIGTICENCIIRRKKLDSVILE